jgi:hypothetical protein
MNKKYLREKEYEIGEFEKLDIYIGEGAQRDNIFIVTIKQFHLEGNESNSFRIPKKYMDDKLIIDKLITEFNGKFMKKDDAARFNLVTIYDNKQQTLDWLESLELMYKLIG